jgi:cyclase
MLKRRIIPKILIRKLPAGKPEFEVLISQNYSNFKTVGTLKSQLRIFESNKVDELLVINTNKAPNSLDFEFYQSVKESIEFLSTPIIVGGGIKDLSEVTNLIDVGVDKVICGISTFDHAFHNKVANRLGSQALVVSLDYTINSEGIFVGNVPRKFHNWVAFTKLIRNIEDSGAGEIILNRIDFDGARMGLDLGTLKLVLEITNVPVVLSSGAGKSEHFIEAFRQGADAVAAGTFFAKMDQSPLQLRSRIFNSGVIIRK